MKWDTVIEQKTMGLARHLVGRSRLLGFSESKPDLERTDNIQLQKLVLGLSQSDVRRLRDRKSTLYHLKARKTLPILGPIRMLQRDCIEWK